MKKLSSKFNKAYSRVAFWYSLTTTLSSVSTMMKQEAALTPDDVKALNAINKALRVSINAARQRYILHRESFDSLRKEQANER